MTRYVNAADVEGATQRAIDVAREELLSTGSQLNERHDDPLFSVSKILQIDTFSSVNLPGKGCTFYPMDS